MILPWVLANNNLSTASSRLLNFVSVVLYYVCVWIYITFYLLVQSVCIMHTIYDLNDMIYDIFWENWSVFQWFMSSYSSYCFYLKFRLYSRFLKVTCMFVFTYGRPFLDVEWSNHAILKDVGKVPEYTITIENLKNNSIVFNRNYIKWATCFLVFP